MNTIYSYFHRIQYYETDGMRIVHHSNYIRWMEEARIAFMDDVGYGYDAMERDGIGIPVISVTCDYKAMMRFGQTCRIDVAITSFSPVRMTLSYEFHDAATNELCGTATSGHCFVDENGRPVSLKRHLPEIYEKYRLLAQSDKQP